MVMNNLESLNIDLNEHEKELNYLKKCAKEMNNVIVEAKTNKKAHLKRKEELENDFKARGINPDPETIDEEIMKKCNNLEEIKEKAKSKIAFDLLEKLGRLPSRE